MPQHFIHYLSRRVITRFPHNPDSPWFAGLQAVDDGFLCPKFHVSKRKTGPTRAVGSGDTIWIMSQVFSPWGSLPPGLDARIDVEHVEERNDGALCFISANTSSWFPLADATYILPTLESKTAQGAVGKVINNPSLPIGQSLQSMRLLVSAEPLQAWSLRITTMPANFVSYRISDGTSLAFVKVKQLLIQGEAVFWDRWCLPRRLAERREVVDDHALDDHLMRQLRQSTTVWGIESHAYAAEGSYSSKERVEAVDLEFIARLK